MADNDVIYPIDHNYTHIFPINDLREHVLVGPDCPCEPEIKVDGASLIVVHNAYDHREIVEQAIAIMNGEEE
jgi:hypothetical protein